MTDSPAEVKVVLGTEFDTRLQRALLHVLLDDVPWAAASTLFASSYAR